MLPTKRLIYVIVIVLIISTIFMLYNINEARSVHIAIERIQDESLAFMPEGEWSNQQQLRFVVCGDPDKEIYGDIYRNVIRIMQNLKLSYQAADTVDCTSLPENTMIIFCDDTASNYTDVVQLGDFIENGGKVIMAAGLPEGYTDSYLMPFWGIVEKSVRENYNSLEFVDELLPVQNGAVTFGGYSLSTWIRVRDNVRVYVQDEGKKVPLVYTYSYGDGESCVINGTYLSSLNIAGLLTGAIGALEDTFVYPVLGVKAVFLDNFPMVTVLNDKLCMKLYGCSTDAFVRDTVWPQFRGMALRQNIAYTSSILAEGSEEVGFVSLSDSLFTVIGKSALQHEGELVYAARCSDESTLRFNEELLNSFADVFSNYDVNGLALLGDTTFSPKMRILPNTELSAVRNHLDDNAFFVGQDYFTFPCATSGNNMENGNLFEIYSVLGAYGMISHGFDVNQLIALDEETADWDEEKKQLYVFENEVLENVGFLEAKTLSNTENYVKSYAALAYEWKQEGNRVSLNCRNAVAGQAFFVKSDKDIQNAEGLTFEKVGNGYYIVHLQQSNAFFELG